MTEHKTLMAQDPETTVTERVCWRGALVGTTRRSPAERRIRRAEPAIARQSAVTRGSRTI